MRTADVSAERRPGSFVCFSLLAGASNFRRTADSDANPPRFRQREKKKKKKKKKKENEEED